MIQDSQRIVDETDSGVKMRSGRRDIERRDRISGNMSGSEVFFCGILAEMQGDVKIAGKNANETTTIESKNTKFREAGLLLCRFRLEVEPGLFHLLEKFLIFRRFF